MIPAKKLKTFVELEGKEQTQVPQCKNKAAHLQTSLGICFETLHLSLFLGNFWFVFKFCFGSAEFPQ